MAIQFVDRAAIINDLYDALQQIERGCGNRYAETRATAEIKAIATAALAKASVAMGWECTP